MTNGHPPLFRKKSILQSLGYACIGTIAATTDSLLYLALTRGPHLQFLLANFISVNVGIAVSFTLNTFVNFRKPTRLLARALAFWAVCYVGMAVSMGILGFGTALFGLHDIPLKIAAVVAAGLIQFLLNKFGTFRKI
jgi:putative flippase GtrA